MVKKLIQQPEISNKLEVLDTNKKILHLVHHNCHDAVRNAAAIKANTEPRSVFFSTKSIPSKMPVRKPCSIGHAHHQIRLREGGKSGVSHTAVQFAWQGRGGGGV